MALLIVHPDYLTFDPVRDPATEYPSQYYRDFLEYVRAEYKGQFWQALPREIAAFAAASRLLRSGAPSRKICMVSYSDYSTDNRVIRYAESLAERGDAVDVLCIKSDPRLPKVETLGQVRVHRLQERYGKNEKRKKRPSFAPVGILAARVWLSDSMPDSRDVTI